MTIQNNTGIYARCSNEDENLKRWGLDAQVEKCKAYARENNLSVTKIYQDRSSGGKDERLEFDELIAAAENGEFQFLIIADTSRLFRNAAKMDSYYKWFQEDCGIKVIFVDQPQINGDTSVMAQTIHGVVAVFEEKTLIETSENQKRVNDYFAENGLRRGKLSYGYKRGELCPVPIPEIAKVIIFIFDLYKTGRFSCAEIATILTKNGYKYNGVDFQHKVVNGILKNEFYIGHIKYHEEWQDNGQHEPIIDKDVFEQCQKVFASKTSSRSASPINREIYILSKLIHCNNCGYSICADTKGAKRVRFYEHNVSLKSHARNCDSPSNKILASELEAKWEEICGKIILPDDWVQKTRKRAGLEEYLEPQFEIKKIKRRLARIKKQFINLEIDETEYFQQEAVLQQRLNCAQGISKPVFDVDSLFENLGTLLAHATSEEKKKIMNLLLKDIKIDPETWEFTAIEPYPLFRELFRPICLDFGIELIQPRLRTEG